MTVMDHASLVAQLDACAAALAAFGMDVKDNRVLPPATEDEVSEVETRLGLRLPATTRAAFLGITAGIEWSWWPPEDMELEEPYERVGFGSTWFRLGLLPRLHRHRQEAVEAIFPDPGDPRGDPWRRSLPFCAVGNGDYLAVDLDPAHAGEVLYLEPHGLADAGNGYRMAADLTDLLQRWTPLGQPGPDFSFWCLFTAGPDGPIDPTSETSLGWRSLIGLP